MSRDNDTLEESIEDLTDAGLLTERQAEAWVLRDAELVPRSAAAESMDVSKNVLDKHLAAAREKVEKAEATAEAVESIRTEEIPSTCSDCGRTLGGRFSQNDAEEPICLDCAGIDPEAAFGEGSR